MGIQLTIEFTTAETQPSPNENNMLAAGLIVFRNSDRVLGIIDRFGHRFEGKKPYNAYYVRWCDGKLGYPNESDFQPCG